MVQAGPPGQLLRLTTPATFWDPRLDRKEKRCATASLTCSSVQSAVCLSCSMICRSEDQALFHPADLELRSMPLTTTVNLQQAFLDQQSPCTRQSAQGEEMHVVYGPADGERGGENVCMSGFSEKGRVSCGFLTKACKVSGEACGHDLTY